MTSYAPVFTDPKLDGDFTRDGYVVLPLLNEREVERLKAAYIENVPELPEPIFMTGMGSDLARRKRLGERLYEVLWPPIARLMPDFTIVTGRNFIVKRGADGAGRMLMHQDFSFVDQTVERGVHIWIPLVDVNHQNGCLKVSPGSHRLINHIAGPGGMPNPYAAVLDELDRHCTVSLPMKAGEAIFFDERLMHGSEPNRTPADRPAANIAFIRNGLKQRIHIVNKETPGVLDIFEIDHEFAIRYTSRTTTPGSTPAQCARSARWSTRRCADRRTDRAAAHPRQEGRVASGRLLFAALRKACLELTRSNAEKWLQAD